jgi:hypothetical protein
MTTLLEHGEPGGGRRNSRATSDRPGDTRHPDLRLSSGTKIRPPVSGVNLSLKRPRDMLASGLLGNKVQRVTNVPALLHAEHAVAGYGAPIDQLFRDNQLGLYPKRTGMILHFKALPCYMLNATSAIISDTKSFGRGAKSSMKHDFT